MDKMLDSLYENTYGYHKLIWVRMGWVVEEFSVTLVVICLHHPFAMRYCATGCYIQYNDPSD